MQAPVFQTWTPVPETLSDFSNQAHWSNKLFWLLLQTLSQQIFKEQVWSGKHLYFISSSFLLFSMVNISIFDRTISICIARSCISVFKILLIVIHYTCLSDTKSARNTWLCLYFCGKIQQWQGSKAKVGARKYPIKNDKNGKFLQLQEELCHGVCFWISPSFKWFAGSMRQNNPSCICRTSLKILSWVYALTPQKLRLLLLFPWLLLVTL